MALQGRLFVDGALRAGTIEWEGERISALDFDEPVWDESSLPIIAPGLIDLHIHGFGSCDPLDNLNGMARALARHGTTGFLPTLFPDQPARLGEQCAGLDLSAGHEQGAQASALGLHLEGPFVNPECAGALPLESLAAPSLEALRTVVGPSTGGGRGIRTITLAPELAGSMELIRELSTLGIRVSLGHSKATGEEARRASGAGAVGVTHLFNAMSGIHHRRMGLAGIALTDGVLYSEIIGDLVHVERDAFELALAARGPEGLCLVSDALSGAGTGCDHFHSHGRDHIIREGAAYYPADEEHPEPRLAGSALSQLEMVQRLCARGVVGVEDALTMASSTPARALGLESERGILAVGARADLILLAPDDLSLRQVYVAGEEVSLG